jgi:hypothetical protein
MIIIENSFHIELVDIFTCDDNYSINSSHFIAWIKLVISQFRSLHGSSVRMAIAVVNTIQYNEYIDEAKRSQRL